MSHPDDENHVAKAGFIEQSRNKDLARELVAMQDAIIGNLFDFSEQYPPRFEKAGGFRDEEGLFFYTEEVTFQGIEGVGLGITHTIKGTDAYRKKVGVETSTRVALGLYTDRETWEAYKQFAAYDWEKQFGLTLDEVKERLEDSFTEEEVDEMTFPSDALAPEYATFYFVDKDGNFAKAVNIPEELAAGRIDLQIEGHAVIGIVSVSVPMLARDLVLYKVSLETLSIVVDREFQAAKQDHQP